MKLIEVTSYLEKAKAANQGDEPGALVDAMVAAMSDSGADEESLLTSTQWQSACMVTT